MYKAVTLKKITQRWREEMRSVQKTDWESGAEEAMQHEVSRGGLAECTSLEDGAVWGAWADEKEVWALSVRAHCTYRHTGDQTCQSLNLYNSWKRFFRGSQASFMDLTAVK